MRTKKERLEAAERLIDACIDNKVDLGVKARQFFGEYRHWCPKQKEGMTPEPTGKTAENFKRV